MREIVKAKHVLLEFNGRDVLNISELSVAENERIGLIGASRSGAPRPLQKPHRGFCDTGLRVPDRKTKTAPWGRFFVLVPEVGLEPTRGISPADFESATSANSIIPASCYQCAFRSLRLL